MELDQAAATDVEPDQACLAVDSKNAYGSMYRSTMLRGARIRAGRLAARQATQWSRPTVVWARLHGRWHSFTTHRGGWQGSQLMMHMFALGTEEVICPRQHIFSNDGLARLGYADDLHYYGRVSALAKGWPVIVGALGQAGLEVQHIHTYIHTYIHR